MIAIPKKSNRISRLLSINMLGVPNVKMNRFLAELLCSVADITIY